MKRAPLLAVCAANAVAANMPPAAFDLPAPGGGKVAAEVLAGGSFCRMDAVFERLKGAIAAEDAQEARVATGWTKHVECVQIACDPSPISYGTLLRVYFAVAHAVQGPEAGPQFRSVIFHPAEGQKQVAQVYIRQVGHAHVFPGPRQTHVNLLTGFFTAEDHQPHYARRNPNDPYVTQNVASKLQRLEEQFAILLKP